MPEFRFEILGSPVPKERPRFNSATKRTYTPKKTVGAEKEVALVAKQAYKKAGHKGIISTEVWMDFIFVRAMPQSWSKAKKEQMMDERCIIGADLSNLIKTVEDGINHAGIWTDDVLVSDIRAVKIWGDVAKTEIVLRW
jgi:Holliday junction resolvase RusA-like endonuclease